MSTFGWCQDGHCAGCPGVIQTFYVEKNKVIITGTRECECPHHRGQK